MASIVVAGDTSGTITLSAPAVSGTTTLTLPTTSGTVLTNGTNTNFPTGSVLQVVNATNNTAGLIASSTYGDTGLTATITPTSSSNKILIIVDICGLAKDISSTAVALQLVRNSTSILVFEGSAGWTNSTATIAVGGSGASYLDSPATISATTYKVQYASTGNNSRAWINYPNGGVSPTSTITLIEIKA